MKNYDHEYCSKFSCEGDFYWLQHIIMLKKYNIFIQGMNCHKENYDNNHEYEKILIIAMVGNYWILIFDRTSYNHGMTMVLLVQLVVVINHSISRKFEIFKVRRN